MGCGGSKPSRQQQGSQGWGAQWKEQSKERNSEYRKQKYAAKHGMSSTDQAGVISEFPP